MVKALQKSRAKHNEKLSYEDALEELVCNTMSDIATDEDAMAVFLELDESERKTLISVLRNIANKIREWARSLTSNEYRRLVTESEALRHLANELNKQLKAVEGNAQTQGKKKNLYAGFFADTAPSTFIKAERMSENGVDSETIRKETGWFKSLDGKWRFEIDDSEAEFHREGDVKLRDNPRYLRLVELSDKKTLTSAEQAELSKLEKEFEEDVWRTKWRLDDYLKHDKLFEAYPKLRSVGLDFQSLPEDNGGYYSARSNTIVLNSKIRDNKRLLSIILHETQHGVQNIEGYASGSSVEYWHNRLDNGFDSRSKDTLQEEAELRTQYDEIATNEPEFYGDMKALEEMHPDVPRAPVNWDTLETIGEDPVEWQRYDSQRDALVEKYSEEKVYNFMFLQDKLRRVATRGARTAHELYHSTAGEVEARDVQNRQNLTDEQRKNTRPDIDRQDVVFADDSGVSFALNANAKTEVHKALYDITYQNEVLLRDHTPSIMLSHKGVRDLPMVMNSSHIRENVFTEEEAIELGLRVDKHKHYHGLGKDFFLRVIDGLDDVTEAYRGTKNADDAERRENYFLLVSKVQRNDGVIVNVPIYIEETAQVNRVFMMTNKIATVFDRDNFKDYIRRQIQKGNLVRIKEKSNISSEANALIARAYRNTASIDSISNSEETVKKNSYADVVDLSVDYDNAVEEYLRNKSRENLNNVREFVNAAASKAMPDSVVRDESGKLLKV